MPLFSLSQTSQVLGEDSSSPGRGLAADWSRNAEETVAEELSAESASGLPFIKTSACATLHRRLQHGLADTEGLQLVAEQVSERGRGSRRKGAPH